MKVQQIDTVYYADYSPDQTLINDPLQIENTKIFCGET